MGAEAAQTGGQSPLWSGRHQDLDGLFLEHRRKAGFPDKRTEVPPPNEVRTTNGN